MISNLFNSTQAEARKTAAKAMMDLLIFLQNHTDQDSIIDESDHPWTIGLQSDIFQTSNKEKQFPFSTESAEHKLDKYFV